MTCETAGDVVLRRRVGVHLRRMRAAAGKSTADVAQSGLCRSAKLARIEAGRHPIRPADAIALAQLYGASPQDAFRIGELVRGVGPGSRCEVPGWFDLYTDLVAGAAAISTWQPLMVPELLRTQGYERALRGLPSAGRDTPSPPGRLTGAVRHRLVQGNRRFTAVLGPAVLATPVGGPDVMHEQLAQLRAAADQPGVRIGVLPWSVGAHEGLSGGFTILDFCAAEDPDVLHCQGPAGADYVDDPGVLARHRVTFTALLRAAVDVRDQAVRQSA